MTRSKDAMVYMILLKVKPNQTLYQSSDI